MAKIKLVKLPKKYKYGFRPVGPETSWGWLFDHRISYPKVLLRPICWIKKHQYRIYYPYGIKVKDCKRCSHELYQKRTTEQDVRKKLYKGEIGQLYGVRFIETEK
jgi:hypothetical protein